MIVGHEPDLGQAICNLIGAERLRMKKGAVALVDVPDPREARGELQWLAPPRVLAPAALCLNSEWRVRLPAPSSHDRAGDARAASDLHRVSDPHFTRRPCGNRDRRGPWHRPRDRACAGLAGRARGDRRDRREHQARTPPRHRREMGDGAASFVHDRRRGRHVAQRAGQRRRRCARPHRYRRQQRDSRALRGCGLNAADRVGP